MLNNKKLLAIILAVLILLAAFPKGAFAITIHSSPEIDNNTEEVVKDMDEKDIYQEEIENIPSESVEESFPSGNIETPAKSEPSPPAPTEESEVEIIPPKIEVDIIPEESIPSEEIIEVQPSEEPANNKDKEIIDNSNESPEPTVIPEIENTEPPIEAPPITESKETLNPTDISDWRLSPKEARARAKYILSPEIIPIDVTVPKEFYIEFNELGECSSEFKLTNNGNLPVRINEMTISPINGWQLKPGDTDYTLTGVNEKLLSIHVLGQDVYEGLNLQDVIIDAGETHCLPYELKIPARSYSIIEEIIKVYFDFQPVFQPLELNSFDYESVQLIDDKFSINFKRQLSNVEHVELIYDNNSYILETEDNLIDDFIANFNINEIKIEPIKDLELHLYNKNDLIDVYTISDSVSVPPIEPLDDPTPTPSEEEMPAPEPSVGPTEPLEPSIEPSDPPEDIILPEENTPTTDNGEIKEPLEPEPLPEEEADIILPEEPSTPEIPIIPPTTDETNQDEQVPSEKVEDKNDDKIDCSGEKNTGNSIIDNLDIVEGSPPELEDCPF